MTQRVKVSNATILTPKEELSVVSLPLMKSELSAGFPSPAEEYQEGQLDINEYLIHRPAATFFVRIIGDSMKEAGILDGSIVVVDRSIEAKSDHIIVAALNGELTIKRLRVYKGQCTLIPENRKYPHIKVSTGDSFMIWGVVTSVIHRFITA